MEKESKKSKMKKLIIGLLLFLFAFVVYADNPSVTLAWDANEEPEVIGYNIYWKNHINEEYQKDRIYEVLEDDLIDPLHPQVTIFGLGSTLTYYFVTTAFSTDAESGYSNEVVWSYEEEDGGGSSGGSGGGCFISTIGG